MTKAEFIAECRGIETKGSDFWNDPEVWGAVWGACLSVKQYQAEATKTPQPPDPSDNGGDDMA